MKNCKKNSVKKAISFLTNVPSEVYTSFTRVCAIPHASRCCHKTLPQNPKTVLSSSPSLSSEAAEISVSSISFERKAVANGRC